MAKRTKHLQSNFDDLELFLEHLEKKKHCQPNTIEIYEQYEKKMLEWAGNRYLYNADKFRLSFPAFLHSLRKDDGSEYHQNFVNGACSFGRRFFEFAIRKLPSYQGKNLLILLMILRRLRKPLALINYSTIRRMKCRKLLCWNL